MTAGIALDYGTVVTRLPFVGGTEWQFQDESIPLAPLEHWLLIYRFHNPKRSESLEPLVSDEKWRKFVRAVGLPDGFTGCGQRGRHPTGVTVKRLRLVGVPRLCVRRSGCGW